jgi:hypothetical protein
VRARAALAIAAALLASSARAQSSDGPQGAPPAEAVPAAPAPSYAPSTFLGLETGVTAIGGAGGALELTLVAAWPHLALGVYGGLAGGFHGVGTSIGITGGPRFRLGEETRLDLLADAGVVMYGGSSGISSGPYGSNTSATLAAVGLRIGITFEWPRSGWALTLGAAARAIPETSESYTVQDCSVVPIGPCPTHTETDTWGGSFAGLYVALAVR